MSSPPNTSYNEDSSKVLNINHFILHLYSRLNHVSGVFILCFSLNLACLFAFY